MASKVVPEYDIFQFLLTQYVQIFFSTEIAGISYKLLL